MQLCDNSFLQVPQLVLAALQKAEGISGTLRTQLSNLNVHFILSLSRYLEMRRPIKNGDPGAFCLKSGPIDTPFGVAAVLFVDSFGLS